MPSSNPRAKNEAACLMGVASSGTWFMMDCGPVLLTGGGSGWAGFTNDGEPVPLMREPSSGGRFTKGRGSFFLAGGTLLGTGFPEDCGAVGFTGEGGVSRAGFTKEREAVFFSGGFCLG